MKTVITAIANPIINNELKKEKNIEVIGNDIQYKDGVIEILEKNIEVNYIILSDILIGEELLINLIRKINENLCLLDGLYVLEEYRNQKIASSLLNEAIDRCKKLNVKYIDINVMEKNELAKRIYKKLDFTEYEVKLRKNIVNS